jgi:AcrR family transcriptional regulator
MVEPLESRPDAAQKLIRATEQLVAERGVEGTSVREILRRSKQKNNSAIYRHFGSKANLIGTVFDLRQSQLDVCRAVYLQRPADSPDEKAGLLRALLVPILYTFTGQERSVFAKFVLHLILNAPNSSIFDLSRQPPSTVLIMTRLRRCSSDLSDHVFRFRVSMAAMHFLQAIVYCEMDQESGGIGLSDLEWDKLIESLALTL